MAINEPPAARRHKKDRSSIGSKTADRSSIGSKTLSFHQKKGRFAGGGFGGRNHKSDRLDRIRKDALDDFTRATHKRSQSVHQMAAMYASSTTSAMSTSWGKAAAADEGGERDELDASLPGAITGPLNKGLAGLVSAPSGGRTLESIVKEAQNQSEVIGENSRPGGEGDEPLSLSPCTSSPAQPIPEPIKTKSFSGLSNTSDERARDLKKSHLNEALDVTSGRVGNVKDIASAFKGESRPENVEVFHKRHKEQEAEYRDKVHQGKETLKKTSQGTDAMYNFVLKLNLATREGKALFMRKWAIGRIANGESITPREGWKFLQSLGIDVPKASSPGAQKKLPGGTADSEITSPPANPTGDKMPTTPASRGRGRVRHTPGRFGRPAAGDGGVGGGAGGGNGGSGGGGGDGKQHEAAAWEVAMSEAVGAVVRVDADARAPKLGFQRSGSEPRKAPTNMPRAPDTCRAPRSKSFFFGSDTKTAAAAATPAPPAAKSDDGLPLAEEEEDEDEGGDDVGGLSAISPTGSTMGGLAMSMELWRQEAREGRPQSQAFGTRGPSLESGGRASVSSRLSDALSPPRRSGGGVRISMNPRSDSPMRFSLSPGRASNGRSPLTPTEKADRSAAAALSAKVSWDCAGTPPPLEGGGGGGGLRLPAGLFAGGRDGNDDEGSEERFDFSPTAAPGRQGFGDVGAEDLIVFAPDGPEGGPAEGAGAGSWPPDVSSREDQGGKAGRVSTSTGGGSRLDNPDARAERLSMVSVVGPGTLSDEEEEEEEEEGEEEGKSSFVAGSSARPGGECPPSPGLAVVPALGATAVPGGQEEPAGVVDPETAMAAGGGSPLPVDDGDEENAEQDSVLMEEIARMDEESILLEAESDLMAVAIDSNGDDNGDDADVSSRRGDDAHGAHEGNSSSLDDSGYAPDAETTPSPARVSDADADTPVIGSDGGDQQERAVMSDVGESAGATAAVTVTVKSTDGSGDAVVDPTDDDHSGYTPSAEEEQGEDGGGLPPREGQGAPAGTEAGAAGAAACAAAAAAVVDTAVRETLEDLTAGVAILVGDEQFLSCSEVLSELQSDAEGDCDKAAQDAADEDEEEEGPAVTDGEVGECLRTAPHKSLNLKIAVGPDLQEEEPPVPRLQWGVNSILMDSPLTPSRYDSGGSREPSTCSLSPCRLAFTGLLQETPEEEDGQERHAGGGSAGPPAIELEGGGDAADDIDAAEGGRAPSPREAPLMALMGPLSPLRVGSSPKALDESEPSKADKWGGRLSALSEGRESRASGGSSDGDDDDVEDGTASLNKSRCMTGGTEETASPSSRRVSTESLPPAGATVADFAGLAGGVAGPGQDDDAEDDGADAAGDEKRARSRSGEGESDGSNPGREDESNNGNDRVQSQDEGVETDAAPAAEDEPTVCLGGGVPVPVPVPDPLAAAPDAALGLPLPATPAGSPEGKVSPAAPASSPLDPTELAGMETTAVVLPAELGGDVGGERSSEDDGLVVTAREEETQGGLRLNTSVSDPYEDFDQLHDRDHFSAATVELDCRTPGGMFNFCRPRSGTVYESAKGAGPGFFSEAPAATGASRQEQDGASPVEGLSDAHQGCTIS